ncbi:FMN-binding negative transcriptional regulator [Bhargavaea cecembensis]|uniref:FMN-binding negative transcriptional regulator n=1 Tax=Bhargavaea cecembensis TaxID=394098 RepID=UPI000590CBDD|nr:FMN-binding negative transcriptional regulator [Bhargavaea cecembensis]
MYIPRKYQVRDMEEIETFIRANPFGIVVTLKEGSPVATHIPLQLRTVDGEHYLTGHLAYGNAQWKAFGADEEVLIIFQGPHSYISPSWYEQENVPTWNYQAVHVYGKPEIMEGEELHRDLALLMEKYEKHREHPVLWDTLSPELLETELKGIVGFKIRVGRIEAAFKLSQNRSDSDYRNIIRHLGQEDDPLAADVAEAMGKIRPGETE